MAAKLRVSFKITAAQQTILKAASSLQNTALALKIMADAIDQYPRNQFGATVIPAKERKRVLALLEGLAKTTDENSITMDSLYKLES